MRNVFHVDEHVSKLEKKKKKAITFELHRIEIEFGLAKNIIEKLIKIDH